MSSDERDIVLDRESVLRGLPARRAATALYLIESRTAYLALRARRDTVPLPLENEADGREDEFIKAFSLSTHPSVPVTIQQIEQFAPLWAPLAPDTARSRAALAHRLAEKYSFTHAAVPTLREALGLDEPAVQNAYRALYDAPLATIFAAETPLAARPAWYWQRFSSWTERLHPFWLAFALALPVGPGLMALPIALAGVRPIVAVGLILLFALVNMVTVAAMAEAVARSGITRYGQGYLGQLVGDWLGPAGSIFLTFAFAVDGVLILPVFYLGLATTLAQATGLGSPVWVAAVFAVGLYFLSRRTLTTTVASILLITVVNVTILLLIPLLTASRFSAAALTHAGIATGGSVALIFGVMLSNFFAHQLVANYGRVVLRRDPGARHWVRGSLASIVATALISVLWVLAVDGSLPAGALRSERGTVVAALGAHVNPLIAVLGSILVILSLGMLTIHISLGLLFTTKERLPRRLRDHRQLGVVLPILPVAAIFLITEWLAISGAISFATLLGFVTVMTLTTLGCFFPALLLVAGRRKSDVVLVGGAGPLGNPVLLGFVYVLFLAIIFIYGLFVWSSPLERVVTLAAAITITIGTVIVLRRGMLTSRVVLEVREDENAGAATSYAVVGAGRPLAAGVTIETDQGASYLTASGGPLAPYDRLRTIRFDLPATGAREVKIWAHRVTAIGESVGLPATARIGEGRDARVIDLGLCDGWIVLPLNGTPAPIFIDFPAGTLSPRDA